MASMKQQIESPVTAEEIENTVVREDASLAVRRYFTIQGRDPFDEIEWETRDAFIPGKDKPVFEQKDVEFPKFWSQTATNIVAQRYFRGRMTSPDRERSVRQMIGRVVDTISAWGRAGGYFATDEEADTFEAELKAILVNQLASFNSPVWFNVGFEEKPQCSACQPYDALISTPDGMVPIGQLVEDEQVGREVYDEYGWIGHNLGVALPDVHRHVREVTRDDGSVSCRRIRLYGEQLREFVERWDLLARGTDIRVPSRLWIGSHDEITAYLRSIFQA